jgi:UDP-N-acetylmuramate dehydrogenase
MEVRDRRTLARVLRFCRDSAVPCRVLGRGSNVVISDQGLRGVVVLLGGEFSRIRLNGETRTGKRGFRAGAGVALDALAAFAEKNGLSGAEFLAGIPGTVGGGLQSNAGAFGRSLSGIVSQVTALDVQGGERVLGRADLKSEYRRPVLSSELVVLEAEFELEPGAGKTVAEIRELRRARHPLEPSAGSYFRNPVRASQPEGGQERVPAGQLIDQCGLKGRSVGGAAVSGLHGNFIVNTGRARFSHVYELAQAVKSVVEEKTGFRLEEEVRYLPERGTGMSQNPGMVAQRGREE